MHLARRQTPEDRELERKRARLSAIEAKLVERELELATLRGELCVFERKYLSVVGVKYAELDDLLAQIAEAEARLRPNQEAFARKAQEERQRARDSAAAAGVQDKGDVDKGFVPSEELKRLFREVAKAVHPDLGSDDAERVRRHPFMADANEAFAKGDAEGLRAILRKWESSPESVKGDGVGADLVRTLRKVAQAEERLRAIKQEIAELKASELFTMMAKAAEAEKQGRDMLAELAARAESQIRDAQVRLSALSRKAKR